MTDRDIAVVGMACVFPESANMTAYWRNIVNGHGSAAGLAELFNRVDQIWQSFLRLH